MTGSACEMCAAGDRVCEIGLAGDMLSVSHSSLGASRGCIKRN